MLTLVFASGEIVVGKPVVVGLGYHPNLACNFATGFVSEAVDDGKILIFDSVDHMFVVFPLLTGPVVVVAFDPAADVLRITPVATGDHNASPARYFALKRKVGNFRSVGTLRANIYVGMHRLEYPDTGFPLVKSRVRFGIKHGLRD